MDLVRTITRKVEELEETDVLDHQPLYDAVDVDALEAVIDSVDGPFEVQFTYDGYTVTVMGEDEISICAITDGDSLESTSRQRST